MTDIHNQASVLKSLKTNIQTSDDISEADADTLLAFYQWLAREGLSKSRVLRYLHTGKKIAEYNDQDLPPMTEEKLVTILNQIDESAYYHREYKPSTKKEYWKFLRTFCKFEDDLSVKDEVPHRAAFVPTNAETPYTKPSELLKPEHIRAACRNLSKLRDQAFILTQWDAASRIGETAACRVGDYYEEDGRWMLHIRGNKNSPDRDAWVHIAGPAIRRWLKEDHPAPHDEEAFLFCKLSPENSHEVPGYASFQGIARRAKEAAGIDKDLQKTHLFRKSRVSYLKSAMNMAESAIDKRIGHVMNSDTTRRYTRIGDKESNENYGSQYGLSSNDNQEEDLVPQKCGNCGDVNAGFRDRCYECDGPLRTLKRTTGGNQIDRVKSLIIDAMQEEGMLDELEDIVLNGGAPNQLQTKHGEG